MTNIHLDGQEEDELVPFDEIVAELGRFGRYQKLLYLLVVLPAITSAFPTMIMVFTLGQHKHRCAVPGDGNDSYAPYGEQRKVVTNDSLGQIVIETYTECNILVNYTANGTASSRKCDSWVYDQSIYQTTLISDLNMVCDNVILQSHAGMAYFGGELFGSFTLMSWADISGRKPVLCFCLLMMFVFNIATVWIPNFLTYIIFRFIYGTVDSAYWGIAMIIGLELVHPSKRELAGVSMNYFWCLGEFILCGLAYWLRNWRDLQLATSIPMVLFIGYYFIIEESPRWLLAKGRDEEAHAILRKIAKYNKVTLSEETIKAVHDPIDPNENISLKAACFPIFKSTTVMLWIAVIFFNLFIINMGYYGISLNVGTLGGDVYLDFLVSSILELAGYVICYLLLNRIGRRPFHCTAMIVGGLACLCSIFTVTVSKNAPEWVAIALSMVGKLGVSGAFGDIYIIESEISPTPVRSLIMGIGGIFGQSGSMVAPYVAEINNLVETEFGNALPLIIYGALMFAAGLATLWLPETNRKKLPDTVHESEQLKKNVVKYEDINIESPVYAITRKRQNSEDAYNKSTELDQMCKVTGFHKNE